MFNEASIKAAITQLDHDRVVYTMLNDQKSLDAIVRQKIMLEQRLNAVKTSACGGLNMFKSMLIKAMEEHLKELVAECTPNDPNDPIPTTLEPAAFGAILEIMLLCHERGFDFERLLEGARDMFIFETTGQ